MSVRCSALLVFVVLTANSPVSPNVIDAGYDEPVDYSGYQVLRINFDSRSDSEALLQLEDENGIEFWSDPKFVAINEANEDLKPEAVDVLIAPYARSKIEKFLEETAADQPTVLIPDVQNLIDQQKLEDRKSGFKDGNPAQMDWETYHSIDTIYEFMDNIAKDHSDIATVDVYGYSSEGRPLKAMKIKSGKAKKGIFIEAGSHAREWITPATSTYIIKALLNGANNAELLEQFDWFIVPSANPDGYEFSRRANRLWRKTRSNQTVNNWTGRTCTGVDPNRNWDFHWFEGGSSNVPCSDVFAGKAAFTEPETRDLAAYILRNKNSSNIVAYFAIHSYSELWLLPWGYTKDLPEDYEEVKRVAKIGAQALSVAYGTNFKIGTVPGLLYISSGSSIDWAKGVAGIKYSYTLELRDTGKFGFLLPSKEILPAAEETWDGIKASAVELANL